MRFVADPAALAEFHGSLVAFAEHLRDDRARLEIGVIELEDAWSDASERFRPLMDETLASLRESSDVLETLCGRLSAVRAQLDDRGGPGVTSAARVPGATALRSAAVNPPPQNAAVRAVGVFVPSSLRTRQGRPMQTLALATLAVDSFDWGDANFEREFDEKKHHGHSASEYLALASRLPLILQAMERSGGSPEFPHDSLERQCHEAFFGSDPITLDRRGRLLDVKDGRHRLMACLRLGIDPPVLFDGGTR
jgi:hypothetical protein